MADMDTPQNQTGGNLAPDPQGPAAQTSARSLQAIKGVFSGEYTGARGAFLVVLDPHFLKMERCYVVIAGEHDEFKFHINQDWKNFESGLISAKLQGHIIHQMSLDVQAYLKKVIQDDVAVTLLDFLKTNQMPDVRKILSDVISRAIADSQILMQIAVEQVHETAIQEEASPQAAPEGAAATEGEAVAKAEPVRIRVEPLLAPVSGIAVKNLKPGMTMTVEIRDATQFRQNMGKMLSMKMSGLDRGAVDARVVEITNAEFERMNVLTQLAPNIFGVMTISGELRVKVPDSTIRYVEVMSTGSAGPIRPGLALSSKEFTWAVIAVVTLLVILAYLVFGGII